MKEALREFITERAVRGERVDLQTMLRQLQFEALCAAIDATSTPVPGCTHGHRRRKLAAAARVLKMSRSTANRLLEDFDAMDYGRHVAH